MSGILNMNKNKDDKKTGSAFTGKSGFLNKKQDQGPKTTDPFLQRIEKILNSYTSNNTSYRFQTVVYDPKSSTSHSMVPAKKPDCVTQEEWDQYSASSPDMESMEPKILCGFTDLDKRIQIQADLIDKMKLKDLQDKIADLRADYSKNIKDRLKQLTEKNNEINLELMKFLQKEEIITLQSHPFSPEENEIYDKLEELSQEIQKPNKFNFSLNTLNVNAKMMRENFEARVQIDMPEKSIKSAQEILKTNTDALKALTKVIKKIYKTTDMLSVQLNL